MVVLSIATLLLGGAFAATTLSRHGPDELSMLYVVPVLLFSLELGVGAGVAAAAAAVVLLLAAGRHPGQSPLGFAAFSAVLLIAGVIAGRFSDRMRRARYHQQRLLTSGLRLARLDNLDALPTVLAEELEQALDLASVEVDLSGVPAVVVGDHAGETLSVPISAHGIDFGTVTLGLPAHRSLTPEDRVVATKLALQAGVAADNQRVLVLERERAALRAELEDARTRLASHLRDIGQILDSQDAERRHIARQLHDDTAQAVAAVLMGLRVLEHGLDQELTRKQLEEMSDLARGTLTSVRQLALNLRPPSLDDFGLPTALEAIAEREGTHGARRITLHCYGYPRDLAPDVETCAYHVAEDAIRALNGSVIIKLNVDHDRKRLRIDLTGQADAPGERLPLKLATARARLQLIGGALRTHSNESGETTITAELPLRPGDGVS